MGGREQDTIIQFDSYICKAIHAKLYIDESRYDVVGYSHKQLALSAGTG